MHNKKWKMAYTIIWILVAIAIGFLIRGWGEPLLWGGWFTALSAAAAIATGGNYLDKKEYIRKGIEKPIEK